PKRTMSLCRGMSAFKGRSGNCARDRKVGVKWSLTESHMSLKTILAAKGSEVVSIDFTADLAAAAKLLTKHRIGAVVVLGTAGRLAGILSERDIVRMMAESGSAVHHLPVAQAMTRKVSTCEVTDSINSVIERMTKGKFRHMPVLDKDRLAGM